VICKLFLESILISEFNPVGRKVVSFELTNPTVLRSMKFATLLTELLQFFSFALAADIEQLNRFPCGGYADECSIVFLAHPCIILTALEVRKVFEA
jgi:hypothetical protein